jgi:hypothetical protein
MPKRWAKERRKGGKGREGPASALRRERTQMSSHQRPARPAGQPRETEFPSLAHSAWKTKGCRVGEGSRDALPGWASRWIVRRISGVLSWGVVSLASTREAPGPEATQRNEDGTPHAARQARHFNCAMCGTAPPGPPRTLSHAHQPAKQDDWATPLAFVPPEIGSPHAQEWSTGESRLGTFPTTVGKPSWLGVWLRIS